jgi:glycosyltransferase involved in cell wall biosynthesis
MYADADVFAMLSRYEAYSIVIAEALTAGTPCVVAKTSALSEWVDGKTCFGVDYPINLNLLATCISDVLNSQSKGMSKWTGTKIIDWNDVTNRLERLYT